MKQSSAGIIAGVIAGFFYPTMQYLVSFLASGGKLTFLYEATLFSQLPWVRQLGLTVEMVLLLIFFGFAVSSGIYGGVGAVLGVLFVKLLTRFAIRTIYLWALSWGVTFYALVFSFQFATTRTLVDVYTLIAIIIDSLVFSILYVRWTKASTGFVRETPSSTRAH